ncbi:MAG: UDP-2,3-diacylglucosamine diphosphatase LpxI [Pseudomonadota bacterium]
MTAPLGLIAGLGDLPVQVAQAATASGQGVHVLRLKGFEEPRLSVFPGDVVGIAQLGRVFKAFKSVGCKQVCFAGIVKRPDFSALKPDMTGIGLLPRVLNAARKGDDALLRVLIEAFEKEGFEVIGAEQVTGTLQAGEGLIAGSNPSELVLADLKKAAEIASDLGRHDIGQGVIVCDGLVLCVEAQEGTDAMLARCSTLDVALRGTPEARRGVLVKRPKPIQDRRIDLPTIGVATLEGAAKAGLAGIGFEAGGALLIGGDALIEKAEALDLFLYGFPKDWGK